MTRQITLLCVMVAGFGVRGLHAQSAEESLGPKDTGGRKIYLADEMKSLHSAIKPELANVHPRVYFTAAELAALRHKAHGPQKQFWQERLASLRIFKGDPPPPPAEKRRAQNDVALAIAEAAFVYSIDRDPKVLAGLRRYMDAAVSYQIWGYSWSKPNVDLAAGHLLYGMGIAYDLLYNDLTPQEREMYRACITRHARLLYDYFAPKPGRTWSYSQNHTFIPIAGLAVASYALYGETPEAQQWAALSRAIYDRVLKTYSKDGYYFEGFEYWIFATPWIIHYLDALRHATGEDLFDQPGLRETHLYAAHSLTPGGEMMFDFGDVFEGGVTRSRRGDDYERSHPGGHFESNYNLLYDLAARFHSAEIQGVADWMKSQGHTSQEEWWTLAWRDSTLKPEPMEQVSASHWFRDHDVVFWRSDWGKNATAAAFKSGPAEGHAAAALKKQLPDWHFEQGHAHPDVNSFIIWAHGAYLTGDSGYSGVPKTIDHNTLLIDGHGQGTDGVGHDAWAKYDYDRLNQVHIVSANFTKTGFIVIGEGAAAYAPSLGLTRYRRTFALKAAGTATVHDEITAEGAHIYTEMLHADGNIDAVAKNRFVLHPVLPQSVSLTATIVVPAVIDAQVKPNIVMGPGIPGSVDKGELEKRGERVEATTTQPASGTTFDWTLQL
ncbi:MAG: DUF4962 domain-containing protein [Acidobacteriaceae bacterium]|nr:DUF4962 domain-containing protein [Acidobacteriaceae bacterium]